MKNCKDFDLSKNMIHRSPMLMVDKILEESELNGKTFFKVTDDCIFLTFDGVLQRAAMIEIAAQSFAAIDIFHKRQKNLEPKKGFVVSVRDFKFFCDAKIDDEIVCELKKVDELGLIHIAVARLIDNKNGRLFADGEFRIYELP
ncbi:MAG: hypothetical protein LBB93_05275 [Elusimicrobiota bacterium]|jgi:predicted hotdog family 3-hydroxylacyl-ACP dehydratase|nr:hypothetical protein [Elusimicrobiota bacterium]